MVTKIIMYSMSYAEGLLEELPYVKFYSERSFSYLSSLRDPDTRIILITPEPPDDYIINWHLRDLYQLDEQQVSSARERLILLSPESNRIAPLDALVLDDQLLLTRLRKEIQNQETTIVNFLSSASTDQLCQELDVPMEEGPFSISQRWGDKGSSKVLFYEEGIPCPKGLPHVFMTIDEIKAAADQLITASSPAVRVVVKLNDPGWGDGLGNVIIDGKKLCETGNLSQSVDSMLQSWDDFLRELSRGGAIVEEYLADRIGSPSGQAYINAEGKVEILSTHEQFTISDQYLGCEFPAEEEYRPRMHEALAKVGRRLAANGVRGSFGLDFITLVDSSLLATEINLRKVGPSHVVKYVESVVRSKVSADGNLRVHDRPLYYSHRRIYHPNLLKGLSPKTALRALARKSLLFDHTKGIGAILHILGALRPAGYVESTCLGFTRESAIEISKEVEATLRRAAKLDQPIAG